MAAVMNTLGRGFSFQPNTCTLFSCHEHSQYYGYCPYVVGSAIGVVPYYIVFIPSVSKVFGVRSYSIMMCLKVHTLSVTKIQSHGLCASFVPSLNLCMLNNAHSGLQET